MELTAEMAACREGRGEPERPVGEFRRTVLLAPPAAGSDGGLMPAVRGGVRRLYAFTDEEALARFAHARGAGDREWEYLSVLGAHLVDVVVPLVGGPAGIAVNVADENGSMLFPPVLGIVPESCAVDRTDAA
ncbi:hypothetical protein [Streptomyces sp. WAC08241]|uniref:hypothetical protein n=1 Tax=Streptomyces sp. WAC08241 TaxID=2487421 RepID=UPI000F7B74EE|nr:hypothetical protein [Streptomyces sp. WAC08241]RSS43146.1 hypothetical protein EF906_10340 [Streptomyces sp. WAC08241]